MIQLDKLVSGAHRNRLFWLLQCTGWLTVALLTLAFTGLSYVAWHEAFLLAVARSGFGFVATCILHLLYRRIRTASRSPGFIAFITLLISGVVGAADVVLTLNLGHAISLDMADSELSRFLQASFLMRWTIYWVWSMLYFGINYWLDTQHVQFALTEAEAAARTSELNALRAQINPHFLFNALGSILAESEHPRTVRELTLALSDYLRFSLQQHGELEPLKTELNALENYLKVEQARFEENLEYHINADKAALETPVPSALVQPLLENAIKYGQRSSIRPLVLTINASLTQDALQVTVTNSGEWIPPESNTSTQTGLANLRRRLQLIYGKHAGLDFINDGKAVVARVQLPLIAAKVKA